MSDYQKAAREYMRSQKRKEREELRIAREIGRARKELEKAEERQVAQWEVEEFQAQLNVVLSLHREAGERWDWNQIVASLPPYPPAPTRRREVRVNQDLAIASIEAQKRAEGLIEEAKKEDRLENEASMKVYEEEKAEWERMRALGRRILAGDLEAYKAVVTEFSPLAEMEHLGSMIEFTMHSASLVECRLTMKDAAAIPPDIKSLTSTGKLSVRAMPRQQFHEVYQDYICGGVLRVAREMTALLPVDDVLVTVLAPVSTDFYGGTSDQPVLSVVVERTALDRMNFERLDPSDTVETLVYRGDFKATRKAGAFQPIIPISWEAVILPTHGGGFEDLLRQVATLRNEIKEKQSKLQETSAT